MSFDRIISKEFRPVTWMFTRTNWYDIHDCYKPYYCNNCKKIDWLAATQNGIRVAPILPLKMPDFFQTSDMRAFVVSESVRKSFVSFSKNIAEFFPIPDVKERFVLLPSRRFTPPEKVPESEDWLQENGPWRTEYPRCTACKNFPDLCFRSSWYTVPDDVVLAGIVIGVKSMILVASHEFSDHLRKAKLTGLSIEKNAFANPKK